MLVKEALVDLDSLRPVSGPELGRAIAIRG
jgi:hypothetical protein